MKIIKLTPRGYCHGVVNAINVLENVIDDAKYERPIHMLGMIIHNKHTIEYFENKGVVIVDDKTKTRLELLDEIESGTVVITAHGCSPEVIEKAKSKNLTIVNATCKDVEKVHLNIVEKLDQGYKILYVGKKRHPETEGVLGISKSIYLITSEDDIDNINFDNTEKYYITNQTTLSKFDLNSIFDKINCQSSAKIMYDNEICDATTVRQNAVIMQDKVDLCIVVGDRYSSNTAKLVEVSEKYAGIKAIQVETINDLDLTEISTLSSVSVTSGASTPTHITNEVIQTLEKLKKS